MRTRRASRKGFMPRSIFAATGPTGQWTAAMSSSTVRRLAPDDPRYVQPDPRLSLARSAEGRCFAELQRQVDGFRQGGEPQRLCQALRAALAEACRPLRDQA